MYRFLCHSCGDVEGPRCQALFQQVNPITDREASCKRVEKILDSEKINDNLEEDKSRDNCRKRSKEGV